MPIKHPLLLDKKHFHDLCRLLFSDNNTYKLFIIVEDAETNADFDRIMKFFSKDEILYSSKNTFRITTVFGFVYIVKK